MRMWAVKQMCVCVSITSLGNAEGKVWKGVCVCVAGRDIDVGVILMTVINIFLLVCICAPFLPRRYVCVCVFVRPAWS